MSRICSVLLAVLTLFLYSISAWSQATVNEGLETAFIYVDVNKGSDSNPGTKQLPLKTIGAGANMAMSNNQASIGSKVIINPGTYREAVSIVGSLKTTSLPITFQAATTGTAIVSGADIWTGWKVNGSNGAYTNSWPYKWGLCPADVGNPNPEEDIVRRSEMIFVNGTAMTQVMTLSAMRQSTFYVDETHATVYLWPPSGTNMNTATVEVSTRPALFTIQKMSNLVLRGLTFQYASTCRGSGAVDVQTDNVVTNVLIDTNFFYWNNAVGLELIGTQYTTIQNSIGNHNGVSGLEDYHTLNALWQDDQTSFNGWRGAQGVYYGWGAAGTHFGGAHNQTVTDVTSTYNQTFGFHWDTDNEDDTVTSITSSENLVSAGFVELSQGPITVSNSLFCSGTPYTGPNNQGFEARNSERITLTGDTLLNNENGLVVTGIAGGAEITNWQTGQTYNLVTQNMTLENDIFDIGSGEYLFSDGELDGSDWTSFQRTLASDYNTWWEGSTTKAFLVPTPVQWTATTFSGWQTDTDQDKHSSWKQPTNEKCNPAVDKPDYWFIMNAFDGYQTVSPGQAATFTAYLVPLNFGSTVTLASDGLQGIAGMSGNWSPGTMSGSSSATFTVNTSKSTPAGSYPITLIATSGSTIHTMTVTVTVQ